MSVWTAFVVFAAVAAMSAYLLRASGVWRSLFGPRLDLRPDRHVDPIQTGDREWIDNHSFWELDEGDAPTSADDDAGFWGEGEQTG